MTIKELGKYYYIKQNIKQLEERMEEINCQILTSSKISEVKVTSSHTDNNPTEKIVLKLEMLKEQLQKEYSKLIDKEMEINSFLQSVNDEEIKYIITERFLNLKSWYEISADMDCDRTTPYYKLKSYINSQNKK